MSGTVGPRIPPFMNTYSLDFDGVEDYMTCGYISELSQTQTFTISVWLKFDNVSGTQRILGQRFNASNLISFAVVGDEVYPSIDGAYGVTTTNLTSDIWYHMVLVFDGTLIGNENRLKLYIDGVQESLLPFVGTIPSTTGVNPNPFYLGTDGFTTPNYYGGLMDEVGIFNTAEPIDNLWDGSGKPTNLASLNPIAWYRMGDNGAYKDPQWLIPSNENKDKVSNYSMEFDGMDDYIDVGSINLGNTFTLSAWVKLNGFASTQNTVFGGGNNIYAIYIPNSTTIYFNFGSGFALFTVPTILTSTWYNIIFTRNGSNGEVFVNGISQGTTTALGANNFTVNFLGCEKQTIGTKYYFNGNIDNVSLYNSELSQSDITNIYNGGTPTTISGAISHWKMGENATYVETVNPDGTWTIPDEVGTSDGTSYNLMADSARVGTAPSSSNNAVSFNMDLIDRVEDTPATP